MSSTVSNSPLGDKAGNGGAEYVAVPAGFVQPDTPIRVADAAEYVSDVLAGVDNMLLELRDQLLDDLPNNLADEQRRAIEQSIEQRIGAARAALDESDPIP